MANIRLEKNSVVREYDHEILKIETWGPNAFRIRATKNNALPNEDWALMPSEGCAEITLTDGSAELVNGKLRAVLSVSGKLTFYHLDGRVLLEEYPRTRENVLSAECSALEIEAREFKGLPGGNYRLAMHFKSTSPDEQIYGMGQYQEPMLNLKGAELELAHRNSQASVPFYLSSLNYGFLWNNPGIGRVVFGKNGTTWRAESTESLDYWITAGDTPAELVCAYTQVTGRVPLMPEYAMGFWQCKLRYQTQEELLGVAREYKRLSIPLSVIVIDFFHWPRMGDWRFDPDFWPDPEAMVTELKEMGVELMVSVWPTVDYRSENFVEMKDKGYLIRTERGIRVSMDFEGMSIHYDPTKPEARDYVWGKIKKNYYDKGIRVFWLDEAEPEYTVYDFENYRYHRGPNVTVGNLYPLMYAQTFYEGMKSEGQGNIINLLRCAWAGSQKYGALVWSGDIHSSWHSLTCQVAAGLNMGLAGIPWWTTDIGGFHGGDPNDPAFRELFIRWFQYGTFCPVMRLHGDREPRQPQVGTTGGATCRSGAPNEIWSYGEEAFVICREFIELRESLRPEIAKAMELAHTEGKPPMRPLFFDYPEDTEAWGVEDEFLFTEGLLVAPVLSADTWKREVYFPKGTWRNIFDGSEVQSEGGRREVCPAPLGMIPVFRRVWE
jgi:alpha-D-xyloside xylohydrolase